MRQPRQRIFDITINGLTSYREAAGNRVALEVQHNLATELNSYVRVQEKYIGGSKASPRDDEEDEP